MRLGQQPLELVGGPAFFSAAICIPTRDGPLNWAWALDGTDSKAEDAIAEFPRYKHLRDLVGAYRGGDYELRDLDKLTDAEPIRVRDNEVFSGAPIDLDLTWKRSSYFFEAPARAVSRATAISTDAPSKSRWREFAIVPKNSRDKNEDADAAVYDILSLFAVRRSWLMSLNAQRRAYRITLPWGIVCIGGIDHLLVPLVTLISKKRTLGFRRTFVVSMLLVPSHGSQLDFTAFRTLRKGFGTLAIDDLSASDPRIESLTGPLAGFLGLNDPNSGPLEPGLDDLFDLTARRMLTLFKTVPAPPRSEAEKEVSLGTLVSIARTQSAMSGVVAKLNGRNSSNVHDALKNPDNGVRRKIETALSCDVWTHGELADLEFDQHRLSNPWQDSQDGVTLYNPLSRTFVHTVDGTNEKFPGTLGWWMIPWLCLLAENACSASEMIRTYRNEVETLDRIEHLPEAHGIIRQMVESMDFVYSIECSPVFKAMQDIVMEKSGLRQDHSDLLRELEVSSQVLRSETAQDQATRLTEFEERVYGSTKLVSTLTVRIERLTIVSIIIAIASTLIALCLLYITYGDIVDRRSKGSGSASQPSAQPAVHSVVRPSIGSQPKRRPAPTLNRP
jgi:hypothetical protein